jgi:hypothetical protein
MDLESIYSEIGKESPRIESKFNQAFRGVLTADAKTGKFCKCLGHPLTDRQFVSLNVYFYERNVSEIVRLCEAIHTDDWSAEDLTRTWK